jgi:ribonuclease E
MSTKMLINASHPEENRVAIVIDGVLNELDIEIAGQEQTKGNIYKAIVIRVETGLQAAFVDYGAEKLGFLQIGEIHPSFYPPKEKANGRSRISDLLHRGQEILVQIVKEERGNKGAALTTNLSLPGRYMVLMPDSSTKGVSRKINDDSERKQLKKTMAELDLPEQMGYIVRTAGIGKDKDELKRDFDYLVRLYEGISARKQQIKAPSQLYQESNLVIRSIRDYFTTDMDEVLIDDSQIYQEAKDFFTLVMPELAHLVKRHRERRPIFSRYQIEEQIESLSKNQTALPSGGSIVIDQTEALVAIDVNSGKMSSESGIEATAYRTNLEAATEVGRQLRLRDLGGLVVIDFIDMRDRKNIREVEQTLRKSLKNDKAKVSFARISQFGLMEMSRQRLKPVLSVGAYQTCPHCNGNGRIKSIEAQAVNVLRLTHTTASKGSIERIEIKVPYEVANYLLNQKRKTVSALEQQLGLQLAIIGCTEMLPGETELEQFKREKSNNNTHEILPISHSNQIEIALAAALQEDQDSPDSVDGADSVDSTETAAEEVPTEQPKKKRRRRRRKPAKKLETGDAAQATAENAVSDSAAAGETAPADSKTTSEQSSDNQPPSAEQPVVASTGSEPAQTDAAIITEPAATVQDAETQKVTASRSETMSTDPAIANAASPVTASTAAAETAQPSDATTTVQQPENSEEKPKRRRGRPRKSETAVAKAALEQKHDAEEQPTGEQTQKTTTETPKKPTRRPRKRATTQAATPNADAGAEAADTQVTGTAQQEKSEGVAEKTRRTTRKAPAKTGRTATQDDALAPLSDQSGTAQEQSAEDPVKKPRRTRKTASAKKAETEEQTTTLGAENAQAVPPAKPAVKKPRRTTKTKTEAETATPATESSADAEPPKRRTRRATIKEPEKATNE